MVYTFPHLGERTQMHWNECKPIDERLRFIARLLEGEKMAPVCREFGISRVAEYIDEPALWYPRAGLSSAQPRRGSQ